MIAEAISLGGGELLVILVIFLAVLGLVIAAVVAGCVLAYRVGRGAGTLEVNLGMILAVEVLVLISSVPAFVSDLNLFILFPGAALLAQGGLYAWGVQRAGAAGDPNRG
ncbi:MAG: hypothetical protein WD232_09365 [Acidimicrobiales bacterium]